MLSILTFLSTKAEPQVLINNIGFDGNNNKGNDNGVWVGNSNRGNNNGNENGNGNGPTKIDYDKFYENFFKW